MAQEILVYIIIIISVIYTVLQFYSFFKTSSDSGCNCSGCDIKKDVAHIKSLIEK